MWWKNDRYESRKDNQNEQLSRNNIGWQQYQQHDDDDEVKSKTEIPPDSSSTYNSYPAPTRDIDSNYNTQHHDDEYGVDQMLQNKSRSRMNRLTRNFQSYGRKRVDRLTTTFQSYGRVPSLFFPNYIPPPLPEEEDSRAMNKHNSGFYSMYSGHESKQFYNPPTTKCKHDGYVDNCNCPENNDNYNINNNNESKKNRRTLKSFLSNKKRNQEHIIAAPAVVFCCPHHNCGGKEDPFGMLPKQVNDNEKPQQEFNNEATIEQQQKDRNDTHNIRNKNNNYPIAEDRSVGTDDSTIVPMYDTKEAAAAEQQRQANMHRGRFYEMLQKEPHNWFPLFSYLSALGMIVALVVSFIQNKQLTGSIIEVSPFNLMLGPSTQVLVFEGARYSPCMRLTDLSHFNCPNISTDNSPSPPSMILGLDSTASSENSCGIQDVCGMTSFENDPNQWYRVITATFVHSGIVHYFCNMLVHLGLGRRVERRLNPLRYGLVWLISGIFGFIASTTFSPTSSATMGCSGSLFGIGALLMIDLLRSWRLIADPGWQLTKLITLMILGLAYGYLPGPDNFAHIGGFIAGLLVGLVVMPSTKQEFYVSKARIIVRWLVRVIILALLIVASSLLLNTFYKGEKPEELFSWCKYLACLPINDMCNIYNV